MESESFLGPSEFPEVLSPAEPHQSQENRDESLPHEFSELSSSAEPHQLPESVSLVNNNDGNERETDILDKKLENNEFLKETVRIGSILL